jgi:DNA-binding response OmpR family regulator
MSDANGKLILLVEDNDDIASYVKLFLETMKLASHHASNADDALEWLKSNRPDLILLDIGLPGTSGWQLLEQIKDQVKEKNIRVVVVTAFTDPANRLVGKFQHIDAYLNKPYEFGQLKKLMGDLLGISIS